jgi:hypothetical protein
LPDEIPAALRFPTIGQRFFRVTSKPLDALRCQFLPIAFWGKTVTLNGRPAFLRWTVRLDLSRGIKSRDKINQKVLKPSQALIRNCIGPFLLCIKHVHDAFAEPSKIGTEYVLELFFELVPTHWSELAVFLLKKHHIFRNR